MDQALADGIVAARRIVPAPQRLYLIDILRGFASLSVVLWHYQHFFMAQPGVWLTSFDQQPWYPYVWVFYTNGFRAVQLFFCISGFVFFHVYAGDIEAARVSPSQFFVLRFSRLYPLHAATLISVVLGQGLLLLLEGRTFVYAHYDVWHFILNVFLASSWGLEQGYSFNGPVWSVSLEIILYALFFAACSFVRGRPEARLPLVCSLAVVGAVVEAMLPMLERTALLGGAISCFFSGGVAFLIWQAIRDTVGVRSPVAAAAGAISLLSAAGFYFGLIDGVMFRLGAFPAAILALALLQSGQPDAGRPYRLIGDITYATYLIHFPIQLLMILLVALLQLSIDYRSPVVLVIYFAAVCLAAIPVYFYFEVPAQRWLRARLLVSGR